MKASAVPCGYRHHKPGMLGPSCGLWPFWRAFLSAFRLSSSPTFSKISPICRGPHIPDALSASHPAHPAHARDSFTGNRRVCAQRSSHVHPHPCREVGRGAGDTREATERGQGGEETWIKALARGSTRGGSLLNMISQTRRQRSSSNNLPIFHTTLRPDRIILASISRCCASERAPRWPSPTSCAMLAVLTASINTDAPVDLHRRTPSQAPCQLAPYPCMLDDQSKARRGEGGPEEEPGDAIPDGRVVCVWGGAGASTTGVNGALTQHGPSP